MAETLTREELDWLRDLHERAQRSVQGSHVRGLLVDALQNRAGALLTLAESALAEPRKPASDEGDVPLRFYSLALDEIWRLRALLAYEATQMPERLRYRTLPGAVRVSLEAAQLRACQAAQGESARVCRPITDLQARLCEIGAKPSLTRSEWEAEQPESTAAPTAAEERQWE